MIGFPLSDSTGCRGEEGALPTDGPSPVGDITAPRYYKLLNALSFPLQLLLDGTGDHVIELEQPENM